MAGCRWEYLVEDEVLAREIYLQDAKIYLLSTLLYVRQKNASILSFDVR